MTSVRPRTVVLVRGGGWRGSDPAKTAELGERVGAGLAAAGWAVELVDPAEGRDGLASVLAAIDRTGARHVWGESSGGHLALVAAARRRGRLDAVVADSAPTDFLPGPDGAAGEWPRWREVALGHFGEEPAVWTPLALALAGALAARVGLIHAADDPVVPVAQAARFASACPGARVLRLEPGPLRLVHGTALPDGAARSLAFGLEVLD